MILFRSVAFIVYYGNGPNNDVNNYFLLIENFINDPFNYANYDDPNDNIFI